MNCELECARLNIISVMMMNKVEMYIGIALFRKLRARAENEEVKEALNKFKKFGIIANVGIVWKRNNINACMKMGRRGKYEVKNNEAKYSKSKSAESV